MTPSFHRIPQYYKSVQVTAELLCELDRVPLGAKLMRGYPKLYESQSIRAFRWKVPLHFALNLTYFAETAKQARQVSYLIREFLPPCPPYWRTMVWRHALAMHNWFCDDEAVANYVKLLSIRRSPD